MTPEQLRTLQYSSSLAWITLNKFVTENQVPIEFKDHRFLIDLYADMHPDIVVIKSAQVGESVERILKSFWACKYLRANVIYVLPTNNVVKDFVAPKVDPLIDSNPLISSMVTKNSESLKQVGDRFIYFKGAFSEREAIAISGDILILDELDRMPNMSVVNTYDSRLQASKFGYRWRLSNPSQVGFGVDGLFKDSDQRHWFVKCESCGHNRWIDWEASSNPEDIPWHYVDQERQIYACGKCHEEISDEARRMGKWVRRFPDVYRHGYWISQMMAPWVSAKRIIEQFNESSIDFFYNFVLGKAYTPSDLIVNRETILRACAPSLIPKVNVVIGVDQNVSEQIWVAGTPQGIFAHGKAHSWEEIEHLKLMYNAIVVCDPAPYPTMPKIMAERYNDWYLCYFPNRDFTGLSVLDWKGSIVQADRTRLLDIVANEITEAKLLFREAPYALEDYIADWQNLYRTTVNEPDGRSKSKWLKKDNKESDYSLATAYFRVGLSRVLSGGGMQLIEPTSQKGNVTDTMTPEGKIENPLGQAIKDTFELLDD